VNNIPESQLGEDSLSTEKLIISALEIQHRISELTNQIGADYEGKDILVIAVLKGAFMFAADFVRRLQKLGLNIEIDFIKASSYGAQTESSKEVRIDLDITSSVSDKNVLLLDDIIDTGHTISFLYQHLKSQSVKSLSTCVLLDKPNRRTVEFQVDYIGFEVPDLFVVGYGLDYNERFRCLPDISHID